MTNTDRTHYERHRASAKEFLTLADETGFWADGLTTQEAEAVRLYCANAQVEALLAIAAALDGNNKEGE